MKYLKTLQALLAGKTRISIIPATPNQKGFWRDRLDADRVYFGVGSFIIAIEGYNP